MLTIPLSSTSSSWSPQFFLLYNHHVSAISSEEYLSLIVLSEFSGTPVLIQKKQQNQRFQFTEPNAGHGLRKWVCRWWKQHFWGQPKPERLFVFSSEVWSTHPQYEPMQLLVSSPFSTKRDQAQLCRLQWGCVSGGSEFTSIFTCGAPSA